MIRLTNCSQNIDPLKCYQTEDNKYIGGAKTTADRRLYYLEHREKYIQYQRKYRDKYNKTIKQRQRIWYIKNKERLRIKYGYKKRYKTKDIKLSMSTTIIKKPILLSFD